MILSDPDLPGRIHGMIDQVGGSELFTLQSAGMDVVSVANIPGLLHHKYLIADKDISNSDPTVLTGSHNFSFNAARVNDENTLIFHSPAITDQFFQDWHARRDQVVGINEAQPTRGMVWPNPASHVTFLSPLLNGYSGVILDAGGRTVGQVNGSTDRINLQGFEKGIYTLRLFKDSKQSTSRFIID
jgi:hypothetical protein